MSFSYRFSSITGFFFLSAVLFTINAQSIKRVTPAGDGAMDGSSWSNATTLQSALSSAVAGDVIWVAAGLYKAHPNDQNVSFVIPTGVAVYGGFEGDETSFIPDNPNTTINEDTRAQDAATRELLHKSVLTADLMDNDIDDNGNTKNDNTKQLLIVAGNATNVIIDGLTITKAKTSKSGAGLSTGSSSSVVVSNCSFLKNFAIGKLGVEGGGAYFGGKATLRNCLFEGNISIFAGGGAVFASTATLTNCIFRDNSVIGAFRRLGGFGGGAYFVKGGGSATNCKFIENSGLSGGGVFIKFSSSVLSFRNCLFESNRSTREGGGLFTLQEIVLTNCLFKSNTSGLGGGLYADARSSLVGCVFSCNKANSGGGVIFRENANLLNCTIFDNMSTGGDSGGIAGNPKTESSAELIIHNSILIGNRGINNGSSQLILTQNASVNADYNIIEGGLTGIRQETGGMLTSVTHLVTVINVDAVFVDAEPLDGHFLWLADKSPAVDAGLDSHFTELDMATDAIGTERKVGTRIDLGAYEQPTSGAPTTQTITFDLAESEIFADHAPITLTPTSSIPDFTAHITLSSNNPSVASITGNQLSIHSGGSTNIEAFHPGDGTYASTRVRRTLTVKRYPHTLSASIHKTSFVVGDPEIAVMGISSAVSEIPNITYNPICSSCITMSGNKITNFLKPRTSLQISIKHPGSRLYESARTRSIYIVVSSPQNPSWEDNRLTISLPKHIYQVGDASVVASWETSSEKLKEIVDMYPDPFQTFTSTDPFVVSIGGDNGYMSPIGQGSALITVTYSAQPYWGHEVNAAYASARVVVTSVPDSSKTDQSLTFALPKTSFGVGETPLNLSSVASSNVMGLNDKMLIHSDNLEVALVNEQNELEFLSVGTATITATNFGDEDYNPAYASARVVVTSVPDSSKTDQSLTFALPKTSFGVGETPLNLSSVASSNVMGLNDKMLIHSDNLEVALVNEQNELEFLSVGTATITATNFGDEDYNPAYASARVVVTSAPDSSKTDQSLTFTLSKTSFGVGETPLNFSSVASSNVMGLNDKMLIHSDNLEVALVNEQNELEFLSVGTATITATNFGDEDYNPAHSSVMITVKNPQVIILAYPNPLRDDMLHLSTAVEEVRVFDMAGRLLERSVHNVRTVDFGNRLAGMYIVEVVLDGTSNRYRVIRGN